MHISIKIRYRNQKRDIKPRINSLKQVFHKTGKNALYHSIGPILEKEDEITPLPSYTKTCSTSPQNMLDILQDHYKPYTIEA